MPIWPFGGKDDDETEKAAATRHSALMLQIHLINARLGSIEVQLEKIMTVGQDLTKVLLDLKAAVTQGIADIEQELAAAQGALNTGDTAAAQAAIVNAQSLVQQLNDEHAKVVAANTPLTPSP